MQILRARNITTGSNGGARQVIETTEGEFKPGLRAITQSDSNAMIKNAGFGQIPANVAVHVTDLNAEAHARLREDPSAVATSIDNNLLDRVSNHHPDALRLHTGVCRGKAPWDPDQDRAWLEAGIESRAHAASLVPVKDETVESLEARMKDAKRFMRAQPAASRKPVVPALRADADNFAELWEWLVAEGEPIVFVELHGYANAHEPFSCILETMRKLDFSPFVIATNGERYPRGNGPKASGALLAAHYGIQTFVQRIHPWFPSEDADSVKWWFNPDRGGYESPAENGTAFMTRCPLDQDHPNASAPWELDTPEALDFRRRDETWAHQQEADAIERYVAEDALDVYIAQRDLLRGGLEWMQR